MWLRRQIIRGLNQWTNRDPVLVWPSVFLKITKKDSKLLGELIYFEHGNTMVWTDALDVTLNLFDPVFTELPKRKHIIRRIKTFKHNGLNKWTSLAQNYQKDSKVKGEKILLNACIFVTRHKITRKTIATVFHSKSLTEQSNSFPWMILIL